MVKRYTKTGSPITTKTSIQFNTIAKIELITKEDTKGKRILIYTLGAGAIAALIYLIVNLFTEGIGGPI